MCINIAHPDRVHVKEGCSMPGILIYIYFLLKMHNAKYHFKAVNVCEFKCLIIFILESIEIDCLRKQIGVYIKGFFSNPGILTTDLLFLLKMHHAKYHLQAVNHVN